MERLRLVNSRRQDRELGDCAVYPHDQTWTQSVHVLVTEASEFRVSCIACLVKKSWISSYGDEDPAVLISNVLKPAEVEGVYTNYE